MICTVTMVTNSMLSVCVTALCLTPQVDLVIITLYIDMYLIFSRGGIIRWCHDSASVTICVHMVHDFDNMQK